MRGLWRARKDGPAIVGSLTEHLAELAPAGLRDAVAAGEGFEVIAGPAVRWGRRSGPEPTDGGLVWRLAQADGPLTAAATLQLDRPHRTGTYQVALTNTADAPVPIDQLFPLVVRFPRLNGPWRVLRVRGGSSENFYPPRAWTPAERVVFGGEVRIESPPRGRSSNRHLPVLIAACGPEPHAPGVWAAMEYSGEWFLTLRHVGDGPFLRGQLKLGPIALAPGERLDLPAVRVGFFDGGIEAGAEAFRRHVRDRVCPRLGGAPAGPPVSYNHWFGLREDANAASLAPQVARAGELGVEAWVHGPGWYEGGANAGVGNWRRADPMRYPDGLEVLARRVRDAGMKFGLWFEIERAEPATWAAREFGHLFLPPVAGQGAARYLDLTQPAARQWAVETIGRWVEKLALEWVRLDCTVAPAAFLSAADPTGKNQIAWSAGLYAMLDELMGRYPQLLIETSSGGGRRIDLGTLRRSHCTWISDQTFTPDICRYMQCRFNRLLPGRLAGSALPVRRRGPAPPVRDYDVLSRMCGALSFSGDIARWRARDVARVRKWVDAYKRIRHLLDGAFRQLLPVPVTDAAWDAVQFEAEDGSESVVFAFRMSGGVQRATLHPRGLDPQGRYTVTNLARPGRPRTLSGADLARRGLPLKLAPQHAACIHLLRQAPTRD